VFDHVDLPFETPAEDGHRDARPPCPSAP
jgi:hypothetical protein